MDMLLDHRTTVFQLAEIARPSSLSSMSVTNFHEDQKEVQREASEAFDWAIEGNTPPKVVVFHISLPDIRIISRLRMRECLLAEFQRLLDRGITFAIPAFSFSFCRSRTYHFKKTRSETGLLPIWVLNTLKVLRTPNPVYSFVVGGPLATEIANCNNSSTFSDDSYFGWFEKNNARIVTIGTYAMTQTHRAESLAGVPYHKYFKISGLGEYGKDPVETHAIIYSRDIDSLPMTDQFAQNVHKTVESLGSSLKRRPFLGTSISYVCCEDLNDRLIPILKKDPFCILKYPEFVKRYIATDDFKNLQLE